jgi:uncharacterized protein
MARPAGSATRRDFRWRTAARIYDETIGVLKSAVRNAKLGQGEELAALQRLDRESRRLEREAKGPGVEQLIAQERERSHDYGGRSVFGWEPPAGAAEHPAVSASRK